MADVKWIKITTDIFDDEKILLIESLPEADSIIVIWFKLLCFAGKTNNSGVFLINDKIAYTDKMLAQIFRRKEATVKLALETFEKFGMIELVDDVITIPNWGKHQNLDGIEKKKEYQRSYMQNYREKQRALACKSNCKTNSNTNRNTNVSRTDKEEEKEEYKKEIEKEKEKKKPVRHKYGQYQNVLLSDDDLEKLKAEFPADWEQRIESVSEYCAVHGKSYSNYLATIRSWARKDKKEAQKTGSQSEVKGASELDAFYAMAAEFANRDDE